MAARSIRVSQKRLAQVRLQEIEHERGEILRAHPELRRRLAPRLGARLVEARSLPSAVIPVVKH